ncbi:MAG: hypothetical protein U0893_04315 [Chloroflexota bacterium]
MIGWIRSPEIEPDTNEAGAVARRMTPEQFMVRRLYRLVALSGRPGLEPAERRLVNHALYATYWDCVGLGMRSQATTILGLPPQRHSTTGR